MIRLSDQGFLDLGDMRLEYRMLGPRPDAAPSLVLLHEGLGSAAIWGSFADDLGRATGAGVFAYSRAGYGNSSPSQLRHLQPTPRKARTRKARTRKARPRASNSMSS